MKQPKKKRFAKYFYLGEQTFDSSVTVVIGDREGIINTMMKWALPVEKEKIEEKVDQPGLSGEFFYIEKDNTICRMIIILEDKLTDGVIIHELYHMICSVMEDKGIPISKDTEEVRAYLLGFYLDEFNKLYKKGKK